MKVVFRNKRFNRIERLSGVKRIYERQGQGRNKSIVMYLYFEMDGKVEKCVRSNCEIISIDEEVAHEE